MNNIINAVREINEQPILSDPTYEALRLTFSTDGTECVVKFFQEVEIWSSVNGYESTWVTTDETEFKKEIIVDALKALNATVAASLK